MTSFSASHPDWLKAGLQQLARDVPQTRVLAVFADDLPHSSLFFTPPADGNQLTEMFNHRARALRQVIFDRLGPVPVTDSETRTMANIYTGYANYSGYGRKWHDLAEPDFFLAHSFIPISQTITPNYAIIGLPPRSMSLTTLLARSFSTNERNITTKVTMDEFCQGIFHHEAEHVRQNSRLNQKMTNRQRERGADYAAIDHLNAADLPHAAAQEVTTRLVWNFLNGIDEDKEGRHWNTLSLRRDGRDPAAEKLEAATHLEVAFRAVAEQNRYADLPRLPEHPTDLLTDVLKRYQSYSLVLRGLHTACLQSEKDHSNLAFGLSRSLKRGEFTYPESRTLAEQTLKAIQTIAPGLLAVNRATINKSFRPL